MVAAVVIASMHSIISGKAVSLVYRQSCFGHFVAQELFVFGCRSEDWKNGYIELVERLRQRRSEPCAA
jgi:hypothetical protein